MWVCQKCSRIAPAKPESMTCRCGLTLTSVETLEKHRVLEIICSSNPYNILIDACAGSGLIEDPRGGCLMEGSPLRLIRAARKKVPSGRCIFIESSRRTYRHLCNAVEQHRDISKPILGDCNEMLPRLINENTSSSIFAYIDPFGYGNPPIDKQIVEKISENPRVDLLISFMWRITRQMGFVREYINSDNPTLKSRADSFQHSLNVYWGSSEWFRWSSMTSWEYAERYASPLRKHSQVEIVGIPPQSRNPSYVLIFATKLNVPELPFRLDKWFKNM